MPSTTNLTTNSRSMNGLNIIDANQINTDNLDVDTLTVNLNGYSPNITPYTTSDQRIANTNFVNGAISSSLSNYAKLNGDQTFSGNNTFSGIVTMQNNLNMNGNIISSGDNIFSGYNLFNAGIEVTNFNLIVDVTSDIELYGNLYVQYGPLYYSISPFEISCLSGITSNIQTQLNNRALLNAFNEFIFAKGQNSNPNLEITDSTTSKSFLFNCAANTGYLNGLTNAGESVFAVQGSAINTQSLCLTTWSSTNCAVKINPSTIRIRAANNWIDYNTTNITVNGPLSCSSTVSIAGNTTLNKVGGSLTNIQYGDLSTFPTTITGTDNLCIGRSIGYNLSTGSQNVVIGIGSANNLSTGTQNLILGSYNAAAITQGSYNVVLSGGSGARFGVSSGEQSNILIGYNSLITHTGDSNICIGRAALRGDAGATTYNSSSNIIIGTSAFFNGQTCSNNVSIGTSSGYLNTVGSNNLFLGFSSGYNNVSNNYLSCIGPQSGDSSILSSNRMIFGGSIANEDYYFAGRPSLYSRDITANVNLFTTSTGTSNILTNASTINIGTSSSTINLNGTINGSISGSNFSEIVSKNSSNVTTFRAEPLNTNISFSAPKTQLTQNDTTTGYVSCCTINITPGFKNQMIRYSFPTSLYNTKTGFVS